MSHKIKTILATALVYLLVCAQSHAQEVDYTQYYLNLPAANAGFTGMEDYLDVKMGFRQGWSDFNTKNNNFYIAAYGILNKAKRSSTINNSLRISNPTLYREIQSDKKLRRKHGLGGMIANRNFGPYQSLSINANYAYHLPVSKTLNLAFGTRVSYANQKINFGNFTVRDEVNDVFYQQLLRANQGIQNLLLADFGSVLYSSRFYFGISTTGLISKPVSGDNLLNEKTDSRINLQTAANLALGNNFTLSPAVKIIHSRDYGLLWTASTRLRYKDIIYLGPGFNSEKKLSLMVGLSAGNRLSINYSYDQYLSDLKDFNATTHEVVIGIALFKKYGVTTKFW